MHSRKRPTPPPPTSGPLWTGDMEEGNMGDWYYPSTGPTGSFGGGEYNDGGGISSASQEQAHTGVWSAKLVLPQGAGGVRLFRWKESQANPAAYYSAWFYFPQRYTVASWWNIFQFKSKTSSRNDPFWIINVGNRSDGSMYLYLYDWVTTKRNYYQTLANVPVGRWMRIEAFLQQSASGAGVLRVWQDGVQVFDLAGITTKYADGDQQWSVNNYSDGVSPAPTTIYVDDALISTTR